MCVFVNQDGSNTIQQPSYTVNWLGEALLKYSRRLQILNPALQMASQTLHKLLSTHNLSTHTLGCAETGEGNRDRSSLPRGRQRSWRAAAHCLALLAGAQV